MFWILVVTTLLLLIYRFILKPQLYWKYKNVPQGPPNPIFGNNLKNLLGLETSTEMIQNTYNRFPNARYIGMYQGTTPALMMRDPDLIKQLTVKDFDHFSDHQSFISDKQESMFSKNLFSLKGDEWREMRATLSPTFTSSKMRSMFNLMQNSAKQYVDFYLEKKQDVYELELKDSFTRFANDVIANCAFGVTVDSLKQPTNEFYMKGFDLTNFTGFAKKLKFMVSIIFPKLMEIFNLRLFPNPEFFKLLVRDTVKMREEENIHRPDMIHLLMEARKGKLKYEEGSELHSSGFATVEESEVGKQSTLLKAPMTDDLMAAQVMIFFFAGFDTISTMMSFMGYELALNPDIQEKLINEVDAAYSKTNGKLTYDVLNQMKYLDMVITENMRKNPPVIGIDRVCTKPYIIEPERPGEVPVHLKKGDMLMLPTSGIHHDEKYYPQPNKFDPERFSDENKDKLIPYTYFPFGSGPRNCIGSRFALMECKTLLYHVLRNFEFVVTKKTTIPMKLSKDNFNPYVEGGFWVGLKKRNI